MEVFTSFVILLLIIAAVVIIFVGNAHNYKRIAYRAETQVGGCVLDISTAQQAQGLIRGGLPHDETEALNAGSVHFFTRANYQYSAQSSECTVDVEVFPQPTNLKETIWYMAVGMFGPFATLHVRIGQQTKNSVYLKYRWSGEENALQKPHSIEYTIMNYLINRIEHEFTVKGYNKTHKNLSSAVAPNQMQHEKQADEAQLLHNKQARAALQKQWWRSYVASAHGLRDYPFWPNPQDYAEAVQASGVNFMDEELKTGEVTMNALGIPRVATGMFASVYQFSKDQHQHWAVRCFNTKLIDQHERYKAISKFILADDLPYTVDFNYLEDGIKVNGYWFPILKMNWVDGLTLDTYIERNLNQPHVLENLRKEFRVMMAKMRQNDIAHGDLQHGNIMIANDEIYLVDYDAFYVPELKGRFSNEIGHPNYNHPQRRDKHFGPYMDNFPAQIIDFSLTILLEDSSTWKRFKGGDECLLFRRKDFLEPESSELVNFLKLHKSAAMQEIAKSLATFLRLEVEEVPYLGGDAQGAALKTGQLQKEI